MADLTTIRVQFETKGDTKAKSSIDGVGKSSKQTSKTGKEMFKTFAKVGTVFTVTAGIALKVVSSLAAIGREAIKTADAIGKTSAKLGLTSEQLQTYQIQAESAGVATDTFNTSFQRFSRRVGEAQVGTGVLKKTFEEMDIQVRKSDGTLKSNTELYEEFNSKLGKVTNTSKALRLAVSAFDTEGAAMAAVAKLTASEMAGLAAETERYGGVLRNDVIIAAEKYETQLGLVERATQNLNTESGLALSPVTLMWAELKNSISQAANELIRASGLMDKFTIDGKKEKLKELGDEIATIQSVTGGLIDPLGIVNKKYKEMAQLRKEIAEIEEKSVIKVDDPAGDTGSGKTPEQIKAEKAAEKAAIESHKAKLNRETILNQLIRDRKDAEIDGIKDVTARLNAQTAAELEVKRQSLQVLFDNIETKKQAEEEFAAFKIALETKTEEEIAALIDENAIRRKEKRDADADDAASSFDKLIASWTDQNQQEEKWQAKRAEWTAKTVDGLAEMAVSGKASFGELASSILKDLAKMIIKQQLFNLIAGLTKSIGTGTGTTGVGDGAGYGGANDNGGRSSGGRAHLIGTGAQPEMFIPDGPGTFIPNADSLGGGGNSTTIINNVRVESKDGESGQQTGAAVSRELERSMKSLIRTELQVQQRPGNLLNPTGI